MSNLYVDLHVLQTVPPCCVNRDDTGSPKTAQYGGVTRARVSSQAWKHAMRLMFNDMFRAEDMGKRTKKIVSIVAGEIAKLDPSADSESLAVKALENAGLKIKSLDKGTDALFFLSTAQAKALAELILANSTDKDKKENEKEKKNEYKAALKGTPSFDMALFGRMVADDPSLNYDAAAQVAHSISTHAVHNEYDYYTAVDDCNEDDQAGAGHIGVAEFSSSTLYRYATVNVRELLQSAGPDTAKVIRCFAEAFICSMPTGKQNSYANRTYPDAVYITIRKDQPVNLVGAFEKAVQGGENGYVDESVKRLVEYARKIYTRFSCSPEKSFGMGDGIECIADDMPLNTLLDALEKSVGELAVAKEVK